MEFGYSRKSQEFLKRISEFMIKSVYPNEERILHQISSGDRWASIRAPRSIV